MPLVTSPTILIYVDPSSVNSGSAATSAFALPSPVARSCTVGSSQRLMLTGTVVRAEVCSVRDFVFAYFLQICGPGSNLEAASLWNVASAYVPFSEGMASAAA